MAFAPSQVRMLAAQDWLLICLEKLKFGKAGRRQEKERGTEAPPAELPRSGAVRSPLSNLC